jgi:hypothetical protein
LPALGEMPSLLRLNLSLNSLSGGLPAELLLSRSVLVLDVSFKNLNGDLPELPSTSAGQGRQPIKLLNVSTLKQPAQRQIPPLTLAGMTNLVALNVSNNSLTGEIPSTICARTPFLSALDLSFNQLNGSVPMDLGRCSALRVLKANHNELHGTLPDELHDVTSLEHISFPNNSLQGALSAERLAELRSLVVLDLAENKLITGGISDSIGRLERLEELRLEHNSMSGELPAATGSEQVLESQNRHSPEQRFPWRPEQRRLLLLAQAKSSRFHGQQLHRHSPWEPVLVQRPHRAPTVLQRLSPPALRGSAGSSRSGSCP